MPIKRYKIFLASSETVLSVVKNNPRQFMRYLTELTKLAYKMKHTSITMDILKEYLYAKFGKEGEQAWREKLK
ncbi:MAG: hypothetical protein MUF15_14080 [Acidobacteria bacterium]|jgi:hypothetical protein|nr:hypothetical protein [Acidobacteriota bacterium]